MKVSLVVWDVSFNISKDPYLSSFRHSLNAGMKERQVATEVLLKQYVLVPEKLAKKSDTKTQNKISFLQLNLLLKRMIYFRF